MEYIIPIEVEREWFYSWMAFNIQKPGTRCKVTPLLIATDHGTGRGWITKQQPVKDAYQNGKWNRFVVRANGDRIQTWVNGVAIADIVDTESSKKGFIGLQVHGIKRDAGPFEVRWRDIRVRELK